MFHKRFGAGWEKTPETTAPSGRHREKHHFRVWVSVALVAASIGTAANAAGRGDGVSGKQIPSGGYAVTSSRQCTGPGTAAVTNNIHGTIQAVSGAGAFAGISATNKKVRVSPGESMDGTVELSVVNHGPGFAVAPLIWTPSWGDPATSWRLISASVSPGQETFATQISVQTPQTPGTYHVVFALQLEMNGANVASATNWARGQPVWGDGNDIAQFSVEQIDEAQKFGCTINSWLTQSGSDLIYVPSDAITVEVGQGDAAQSPGLTTFLKVPANVPWTPTGVQLQKGDEVTISATGIIETNLAGATSSPWGTPPDCSVAGPVRVPFVAPQLPCWSLLGRIGPSGEPFEVGDRIVFKAATGGELYLGVNDNFFGDNSRSWNVTIIGGRAILNRARTDYAGPAPPCSLTLTVRVPSDSHAQWTDTGIKLHPGQVASIDAEGEIWLGTEGDVVGPNGMAKGTGVPGDVNIPCHMEAETYGWKGVSFPAPGLPCGSLVGRIGETGPVFEVSTGATFQSTVAGPLYLALNFGTLDGNTGSWTVTIIVASLAPGTSGQQWAPGQALGVLTVSASPSSVLPGGSFVVSGVVRDVNGDPVSGATVELGISFGGRAVPRTSSPFPVLVRTEADGSYRKAFAAPTMPGSEGIKAMVAGASPATAAWAGVTVGR